MKKHQSLFYKLLYSIIGFLWLTNCFAQYEYAYKLPYPERLKILDSLIDRKIVGLTDAQINEQINLLEKTAKENNDKIAIVHAKLVRFSEERKQRKIPATEANQICLSIIDECEELEYLPLQALTYLGLGNYYFNNQEHKSTSYYYYLKAYKIYANLTNEEFPWKRLSAQILSDCFYKLNDYDRAIKFGLSSINYGLYDYYKIGIIDIIGMSYLHLKKYDSAIYYFKQGITLTASLNKLNIHWGWQGIFEGNLGYCYQKINDASTAITLFKRAIDTTIKYNILDNTCGFAIALSTIYLNQNNAAYQQYLPIATTTTYSHGGKKDRYNLFDLLKTYYTKKGDYAKANLYADSLLMYKDTLAAINGNIAVVKTDFEIESELRTIQEKLLQEEIRQQKIIKYSLVAFILLATIITFLLINRARLQNTITKKNLETKQLIAENELTLAKEQLKALTTRIIEKNNLISQLEDQAKIVESNDIVVELQNFTILTDEQWNDFKTAFEKVHQGFLNNLKSKINNLTPAETRLLALAKLKLTTKEMAGCLGVTPQAVRTAWYRLRAKLNLPTEATVEDFVETI